MSDSTLLPQDCTSFSSQRSLILEKLKSPFQAPATTSEALSSLYPNDPLLCFGWNIYHSETKPLTEWQSSNAFPRFMVPNPMLAVKGMTTKGTPSARSKDNTGPRCYVIAEFDKISLDQQPSAILQLAMKLPLAMVLYSGGKSLHAWFYCQGIPETELAPFLKEATSLGADPAPLNTSCQLVRTPLAHREGSGVLQEILFWNPDASSALRPANSTFPEPSSDSLTSITSITSISSNSSIINVEKGRERKRPPILELLGGELGGTVCTGRGESNFKLFRLARSLLSVAKSLGRPISGSEQKEIFQEWYIRSRPNLDPEQCEELYEDRFDRAIQDARVPVDEKPLHYALNLARASKEPREAGLVKDSNLKLLVSLCFQLHLLHNGRPFYLGCKDVAVLLDVHFTTAADYLRALENRGILKKISQGAKLLRKVSEFQYLESKHSDTIEPKVSVLTQ